jgi:hypothetical protein
MSTIYVSSGVVSRELSKLLRLLGTYLVRILDYWLLGAHGSVVG